MQKTSDTGKVGNYERNRDLVQKRLADPVKWSWRKLAKFYNIHFTTAKDIFLRYAEKYKV